MAAQPIARGSGGSLAAGVVQRIKQQIVEGEFSPGEKLPSESALMETFSVSRTVVREAISRLQEAELVETYRGKGTFVLTLPSEVSFAVDTGLIRTVADRLALLDFRVAFEVEAAALAALRRTPEQLREINRALVSFRASRAKPSGAVDADFHFHLNVAAATNNRYYVELLTSLGPTMIMMPQTRLASTDEPDRLSHFDRVIFEHEAIYGALERSDTWGAGAAMRTHLSNSRARLSQPPG